MTFDFNDPKGRRMRATCGVTDPSTAMIQLFRVLKNGLEREVASNMNLVEVARGEAFHDGEDMYLGDHEIAFRAWAKKIFNEHKAKIPPLSPRQSAVIAMLAALKALEDANTAIDAAREDMKEQFGEYFEGPMVVAVGGQHYIVKKYDSSYELTLTEVDKP